ncbi:MAG: hypothetical protein Q9214_002890 [Letrouitia sp. 1 TL-2023]
MSSNSEILREIFLKVHDVVQPQYEEHQSERIRAKYAKDLLREKEKDFPYLKKKGVEEIYTRFLAFESELASEKAYRPRLTAKAFWYNLYTLPLTSDKGTSSLGHFLNNDFEHLDLGLLKGKTPLRLTVEIGNFLYMQDPPNLPEYDWIEPPDGASAVGYLPEPLPNGQNRVPVERDGPLRRFMEIGTVSWWRFGEWEPTGHIMVIDLDKDRQRHPWIILSNEWVDSWGESVIADSKVETVNSNTPGVFPSDQKRTTIAQLVDRHGLTTRIDDPKKDPFLRRLGKGFHIELKSVTDGKNLVRIMQWNQRAHSTVEECYADGTGRIYLEYDREKNEYMLPDSGLRRGPTGFLSIKPLRARSKSETNAQPASDSKSASHPKPSTQSTSRKLANLALDSRPGYGSQQASPKGKPMPPPPAPIRRQDLQSYPPQQPHHQLNQRPSEPNLPSSMESRNRPSNLAHNSSRQLNEKSSRSSLKSSIEIRNRLAYPAPKSRRQLDQVFLESSPTKEKR